MSEPFRRASRSAYPDKPTTVEAEAAWAAFPLTPLRPEQVAGSVIQASTLQALDSDTHIIQKLRRFGETRDFVKRYGDPRRGGVIRRIRHDPAAAPSHERKLVRERTEPNPIMNASTRLAKYSPSDEATVKAAFLASLTRHPEPAELGHFAWLLAGSKGNDRDRALTDLCWTLINTTEFSWNR